jgi:dynactin complex subunit
MLEQREEQIATLKEELDAIKKELSLIKSELGYEKRKNERKDGTH